MTFDQLRALVVEMPMAVDPMTPVQPPEQSTDKRFERIAAFNHQFMTVEVYHDVQYANGIKYILVDKGETIGKYIGENAENNGIETLIARNKPFMKTKGLMFSFYINFLLTQYAYVRSGKDMTPQGFGFWLNNFDNFKTHGCTISVLKNGRPFKDVDTKEELQTYYTKDYSSRQFQFLIKQ